MSQPLYFLPDLRASHLAPGSKLSRAILAERGLDKVFADVVGTEADCSVSELRGTGPDNLPGAILCYQNPAGEMPSMLGYYPDKQTWHKCRDGQFYIGIDNVRPPSPEDMARKKQCSGYPLELAGGEPWTIPIIRRPDDSSELPKDMILNGDGQIKQPIKEAYLKYWESTAEVCRWMTEETDLTELLPRALALAVEAMSINYRYGIEEQNVCRQIDSENYLALLAFTIDYPKIQQELDAAEDAKKKETESIEPGEPDSSEITDPVEATSSS
jgi:hypothetical protein